MEEYKIYSLNDPITNEVRYIGKTISPLYKRLSSHYRDRKKSYKTHWINGLKKNGLKPIINIIEICNNENWEEREKYWIKHFRKITRLTNYLDGGQGQQVGYKHTKKAKDKIRVAAKLNIKGKFYSGMTFTENTNIKRANANKKQISQLDSNGKLIKNWTGIIDAAKELNIDKNNISSVLKNKTISAGGYLWCYKIETDKFKIKLNKKNRIIIVIDTKDNTIIEFSSIKETSEKMKIERKHIENSLRSKTIKFGFSFQYKLN
jgi:hypothetical protein